MREVGTTTVRAVLFLGSSGHLLILGLGISERAQPRKKA